MKLYVFRSSCLNFSLRTIANDCASAEEYLRKNKVTASYFKDHGLTLQTVSKPEFVTNLF